ncbi:hypothetical protein OIU84_007285 [Salix udensis]|uniref:Pentatricopeptide repeat-containing protein n=1 Tax=Salix udensis TaxID=889485 RepID=A0AAD6JSR1_9ROSI|nr:hypothetical protein OIU84_007285 [Salix udensis]
MQVADRHFKEMLGCGIAPNDVVCTALIDGHCKEGSTMEATSIFRCMLGQGGHPDVRTYSALIHGLLRNGKLQEAMELLSEFLEKGLVP